MAQVNRQYKDQLFKFIFGNSENKEWTLSLYNSIHGTDYTNPDDIHFNTIENAVYMGMKNDLSYIIYFAMEMYEQQSSFNPNMPMRFFLYAGSLYEKYIASSDYYLYSSIEQQTYTAALLPSNACEPGITISGIIMQIMPIYCTFTTVLYVFPVTDNFADITADPFFLPVTTPLFDTLTTLAFDDFHFNVLIS